MTEFKLDSNGTRSRTFQFELVLANGTNPARETIRGDGVVLAGGRVLFNRQAELKQVMSRSGADGDTLLTILSGEVAKKSGKAQLPA
ncbi:hypothetical protein JW859_01870 [bacterium]|nr:hypothetical protein [bacterium]